MTKPLDLSQCENEPVKFIGSIQPFGAFVITNNAQVVTHASENIGEYGAVKIGERLPEFDRKFCVKKKKVKNNYYIEIEDKAPDAHFDVNDLLNKFQRAESLNVLLQKAAESLWELTGFDRVMVYKFHEDFHGEVVAEALKPGVDSFLGLHYPASDIPKQAREIFVENWVRMIPDVNATPVNISGPEVLGLDLSKVTMRAVSPIHLEYLRNMEVGASLTVSIIVDQKLWGLFACHHRGPNYMNLEIRSAAETIGRMTSSLIREAYMRELYRETEKLKKNIFDIQERLDNKVDISVELTKQSPTLQDMLPSEGASAALYVEGYWSTVGKVPTKAQLDALADWLSQQKKEIFATNELSKEFPAAIEYKKIASGLLAAFIPKGKKNYIFWFRPEIVETVRWAGNPDKVVDMVNGRLTPRASFDEWKTINEGKSAPWREWEINAAVDIKNAVIANDLKVQFEKEKKARQEAELAKNAREELMEVVSHDLRNPLSSILMNSHILKKFMDGQEEKTKSILDRIFRSATAMNNLIEDILNVTKLEANQVTLDIKLMPLHGVLQETIDLMHTLANDKNIRLELARDSIECNVEVDHGRMLQVFSNILGNAIKFTPENGSIIAKIDKCGPEFVRISIKDTGPGIPAENLPYVFDRFWQAKEAKRLGTGLGLAIVKGIVERHGGEIWAESVNRQGTTFVMQLPLKAIE